MPALNIESAEETIRILKLKFIQRMKKNEYTSGRTKGRKQNKWTTKKNSERYGSKYMEDIINNIDGFT